MNMHVMHAGVGILHNIVCDPTRIMGSEVEEMNHFEISHMQAMIVCIKHTVCDHSCMHKFGFDFIEFMFKFRLLVG